MRARASVRVRACACVRVCVREHCAASRRLPRVARAAEYELRAGALERLHRVTVEAFPGCGAEPLALFGSSATGLSLPASDLDVSAHVPHGGGRRKNPLDVLAKAVTAGGIAAPGTIQVLRHASVPILKFVEVRPPRARARACRLRRCRRWQPPPVRAATPPVGTHSRANHWPPSAPAGTRVRPSVRPQRDSGISIDVSLDQHAGCANSEAVRRALQASRRPRVGRVRGSRLGSGAFG